MPVTAQALGEQDALFCFQYPDRTDTPARLALRVLQSSYIARQP